MTTEEQRSHRRRRGVARSSLTKLETTITDLQAKPERTKTTRATAQRLLERLNETSTEFKTHHLALVDLAQEDELEAEQKTLDEHEERLSLLTIIVRQIITDCEASMKATTVVPPNKQLAKRLQRVEQGLSMITDAIDAEIAKSTVDYCLLQQHEDQLNDIKTELSSIARDILALKVDDAPLSTLEDKLSRHRFDLSLKLRRALQDNKPTIPTKPEERGGAKLPRLEVPTFDGNLINWRTFWEQYTISVHDRKQFTNTEKLAYLKSALKGGAAKHVIEGLSGSGDDYKEAVECLTKRYNRPRLIHQAHVRAILDTPPLKDGNGKELRRLHDTLSQHLRALRAMDCEPSGPFVTSAIELKFDETTMFEWQKHTHEAVDVPHFSSLLEFINMRAQATESLKSRAAARHISSFATSVNVSCPVCKAPSHPLYTCSKFKTLPYDQMTSIVKSNNLCINCLKPGHRFKQCNSSQRCRRCQKPHHTLLHLEVKSEGPPLNAKQRETPQQTSENVKTFHVAQTSFKSTRMLLMTCQVQVITPQGLTTHARALLDCASSVSFISEHLVQHLRLPRLRQAAQISGIAGMSAHSNTQSVVQFQVSPVWSTDAVVQVEAMVLSKVTCDLPINPVQMDQVWHHLTKLRLADPDFGVPSKIDILLGIDVFTSVLLQGRRQGPVGSPSAFETSLGWVLA